MSTEISARAAPQISGAGDDLVVLAEILDAPPGFNGARPWCHSRLSLCDRRGGSEWRHPGALDSGGVDAIAFGRPFLANPDLPARFAKNTALNEDDMATWYAPGPEGYTDYPTLEVQAAE
ncbi:hypothetical protein KY084_13910 [Stakelama sp. CBK3Z-3]|uniref:NADH:flavin oxidoreductase/NADH oxidase N-terminal domain-containing protein n=1 Tax=Stakelama flava TaxID=2860338 RepID=A0ABS6XQB1_9SPHN|nr:hypothetical protein [Stakelama flava]